MPGDDAPGVRQLRVPDLDTTTFAPRVPVTADAVADVMRTVQASGWDRPCCAVVQAPVGWCVVAGFARVRAAVALDLGTVPVTVWPFERWEQELREWRLIRQRADRLGEVDTDLLQTLRRAAERYQDGDGLQTLLDFPTDTPG